MQFRIGPAIAALISVAAIGVGAQAAPAVAAPTAPRTSVAHAVAFGEDDIQRAANVPDRETAVQGMMNEAFAMFNGRYNVAVYNLSDSHFEDGLQNRVFDRPYRVHYGFFNLQSTDYRVVVFESGTLVNHGDGGWINWGFRGNYQRPETNKVIFTAIQ